MNRKTIILGAILAAFMMLMIPNISAVNTQVTDIATQEKNEQLSLGAIFANIFRQIENLNDNLLRDLIWVVFGIFFIIAGLMATIAGPIMGLLAQIIWIPEGILIKYMEGANILQAIIQGIILALKTGLMFALCGPQAIALGIFMIKNKRYPEAGDNAFIDFVNNLMDSDV